VAAADVPHDLLLCGDSTHHLDAYHPAKATQVAESDSITPLQGNAISVKVNDGKMPQLSPLSGSDQNLF
jgi:hypothetical protein